MSIMGGGVPDSAANTCTPSLAVILCVCVATSSYTQLLKQLAVATGLRLDLQLEQSVNRHQPVLAPLVSLLDHADTKSLVQLFADKVRQVC